MWRLRTRAPRFALVLGAVIPLAGCSASSGDGAATGQDAGNAAAADAAAADAALPGNHDAAPTPDAATGDDDASRDADSSAPVQDASADAPDSSPSPAPDAAPPDSDGDGTPDPTDCAPNDATRWQLLPYSYRDADGDTYTVAQSGTVCSGAVLPSGYADSATGSDCDDANPAIFTLATLFPDTDDDGVGAGTGQPTCIGATPPSDTSLTGTDCAPSDPAAWQLLAYSYVDADGDTYTVAPAMSSMICSGAALPAGYSNTAKGDDCDDHDPKVYDLLTVYPDTDSDGVGAGASTLVCTDGSVPKGDSLSSTDCAPSDPQKWQTLTYSFIDIDGDGVTVAQTGTVCAGATLEPPYYATAHGNDCDDSNPALTTWTIFYPDGDQDGLGTLPLKTFCEAANATVPTGYSRFGDDEDDTNAAVGALPPEDILDLVLD